jgi:hypothetical protein
MFQPIEAIIRFVQLSYKNGIHIIMCTVYLPSYSSNGILRKIFGPVNIDNTRIWRIRNNTESDKLIEGADIVLFIKAQRIK